MCNKIQIQINIEKSNGYRDLLFLNFVSRYFFLGPLLKLAVKLRFR